MNRIIKEEINFTIPLDDLVLSGLDEEEAIRIQKAMNILVMNEPLVAESLLN
jgi:hypothetical protein